VATEAATEEVAVATEAATEEVAVADIKEIAAETVAETAVTTEEAIVVVTVEEIAAPSAAQTEEETEVEPQNPAIGVTVVKAGMEIVDHNVVGTAQRPIQIIRSNNGITNHTVRPHSVQYNSFFRSSLSILNE